MYLPHNRPFAATYWSVLRIASRKICFGLFTNLPPLEVVSNFATRSPLGACTFAQRTEVAILRSLRQIVHEASGGVVVVLAERFRIGPKGRQRGSRSCPACLPTLNGAAAQSIVSYSASPPHRPDYY